MQTTQHIYRAFDDELKFLANRIAGMGGHAERMVDQAVVALVNSDQPGAPNLTVPPHQTKVIDLYYALPPDISSAADVSAFDLLWHVQTPALMVADHTPYSRVRLPSPQATASTSVALGLAHWWYDPLYPALTFNPPPIVLHEKFPALVKQPPHPRLIVGDGRDHH